MAAQPKAPADDASFADPSATRPDEAPAVASDGPSDVSATAERDASPVATADADTSAADRPARRPRYCPHCKAELIPHEVGNEHKPAGSLHCNECGCCFLADGETVRPGHPLCYAAAAELAKEA